MRKVALDALISEAASVFDHNPEQRVTSRKAMLQHLRHPCQHLRQHPLAVAAAVRTIPQRLLRLHLPRRRLHHQQRRLWDRQGMDLATWKATSAEVLGFKLGRLVLGPDMGRPPPTFQDVLHSATSMLSVLVSILRRQLASAHSTERALWPWKHRQVMTVITSQVRTLRLHQFQF